MIFIPDPHHDPYYNMALEEYMFSHRTEEDVLLLWRNDPSVVCGSFQNIFAEVDLTAASQNGIALVRRFSGGGTVYHDLGNLNYTLIRGYCPDQDQYAPFLEPVVRALNHLGIPAERNRQSDIAIHGLKISGSAQRIAGGRHLHHGTLLFRCDLGKLRSAANGARQDYTSKGTLSVPWPVTNIADETGLTWSPQQFQDAFLGALQEEFPIRKCELTEEEEREIHRLADEKYRSWEWIFGRSPRFTCRRSVVLEGEPYQMTFEAVHGVIQEIAFSPDIPALSALLTGRRLNPAEIREVLTQNGISPAFADNLF